MKGEIHFDIDDLGFDSQHRSTLHFQQHGISVTPFVLYNDPVRKTAK